MSMVCDRYSHLVFNLATLEILEWVSHRQGEERNGMIGIMWIYNCG